MNYLNSLNEQQKKAVLATEGPVLIVAGAGAGKTKTITHRILHLINNGVNPENILAITFTNKAAREMRDRVISLLNHQNRIPFISTFHALGVKIIKENAPFLNLPRYFTILDKTDSKKIIKESLEYIGVEPKEHLEKIQSIISSEKSRGKNLSDYLEKDAYDYSSELTKKVWKRYEEILRRDNALDFDDLLMKSLRLLRKNREVLEKYQKLFLYIHVDEYQDTNGVQNDMVELLAQKNKNICVVGDTDQNIYSWRGAEIKNMLHFEKTYPDVNTIFLEENYRSTKIILDVANEIIKKNNYRIPKKLFTQNQEGEKIGLFTGRNETDEAHFIALKAKNLIEMGIDADEIAVLYRANFQSRALEEAFMAYGVQYQMLGTKFFERKEIKDVMSYINASLNPGNISDFVRIANVPARGLGKITLQKIQQGGEKDLNNNTKIKILEVRKMLSDFREILFKEKPSKAIKYIIKHSGIEKMYSTGKEEDTDRLENIRELATSAVQYDDLSPEDGIEKLLTEYSLASDQDSLDDKKKGVRLMTVHSAKGLEFDYVFISGLEDKLFPHKGFGENKSREDKEEERRLFYVAITRARKKIFLTHAEVRTIFGSIEINSPSEFLDDVPPQYIEKESYSGMSPKEVYFSIDF